MGYLNNMVNGKNEILFKQTSNDAFSYAFSTGMKYFFMGMPISIFAIFGKLFTYILYQHFMEANANSIGVSCVLDIL